MLPIRFLSKFLVMENNCWEWQAHKSWGGYGRFWFKKLTMAHRFAFEQLRYPIPKGMFLDHKCRKRACVNPDHLRIVTPTQNSTENIIGAAWQILMAKTHCKRGHEFTPENIIRNKKSPNQRTCRKCTKILKKKYYENGGREKRKIRHLLTGK